MSTNGMNQKHIHCAGEERIIMSANDRNFKEEGKFIAQQLKMCGLAM